MDRCCGARGWGFDRPDGGDARPRSRCEQQCARHVAGRAARAGRGVCSADERRRPRALHRATTARRTASGATSRGRASGLNAIPDRSRASFFGWSEPECGTNTSCTVRVEDALTSVVAVFAPLTLAVKFSDQRRRRHRVGQPAGLPCLRGAGDDAGILPRLSAAHARRPDDHARHDPVPGLERRCPTRTTAASLRTRSPARSPSRTSRHGPGRASRTTIRRRCATTISVEFKLRKSGNGSGRVTASKLDCGSVCTASYGYGRSIALTANPDDGSLFDGWNGVCARTQLTCTFPAGPITSIRAVFVRDATAPTAPGGPVVGTRTRTSLAISWTGSTDNVRVAGYRVYVDDAAGGRDAGNGVHARRPQVRPQLRRRRRLGRLDRQPLAARDRHRPDATVRARGAARRRRRRPCRRRPDDRRLGALEPGDDGAPAAAPERPAGRERALRRQGGDEQAAPPGAALGPRGPYRLATTLVNPDGGTLALPGRGVLLPRP